MNRIALIDKLEGASPYLTLEAAQRATEHDLADLVSQGILLVDYRQRLTADSSLEPLAVCRLNRRHPRVRALDAPS